MRVVLAISGGVDSMILLDIMAYHLHGLLEEQWQELASRGYARMKLTVATYDHGTRASAEDDALFVQKTAAEKYELPCIVGQGDLGENVAEAEARERRYEFLQRIVREMNDPQRVLTTRPNMKPKSLPPMKPESTYIYTAHHLDDLVESIAINLIRGTGWRGLAALDAPGIRRPFLEPELMPKQLRDLVPFDKKTVYAYAANCDVSFRQDPTNNEDNYLRNRVREKLNELDCESCVNNGNDKLDKPEYKMKIYELWQKQKRLKTEIDKIVQELLPAKNEPWQRSWFQNLDEKVALELLRAGTLRAGISATRPQLENFRQAILTYNSGKSFNLPGDKLVKFSKNTFVL